jgi:hypothetical protein
MYKDPTASADGSKVDIRNHDDSLPIDGSETLLFSSATITDDGDYMDSLFVGSDTPGDRAGGESRIGAELLLDAETDYMFRITVASNATAVAFKIGFYEVVPE